jgi:ankyrin repeat protein
LLESGANVNAQDIQLKTALHYAIQEHRFETTKLLLKYNADPFLESKYKDDALQTACLKGASQIFEYLVDHIAYTPERVASAFELLGSTFLDEHHDSQKALQYWRAAADIREKFGLVKQALPAKPQYRMATEFVTRIELEGLALDLDAMRTQSLLICERILGTVHKDMIYRLMYRGAAYADSLQYQHCIDLWKYALELRVAKDSILFCDTCFTAQALVKLFLDLHEKHNVGLINAEVRMEDVTSTIELLVTNLSECSALLELQPQFKRQLDSFDKVLRIITHLLHLVTRLSPIQGTDEMNMFLRRRVHSIVVTMDPRTTLGDTLLHLAVARNNTLKSQNLFEDGQYNFFPSLEVARLIVECGGNVNGFNKANSTPLHTAVAPNNYCREIVELLLDNGAHIDLRNAHGQRPTSMLRNIPGCQINPLKYTSLRCLAAAAVTQHGLRYKNVVPHVLEEVIEAH